jgi:hypothetical protein
MIEASILIRDFAIQHGYSEYSEFRSDFEYGLCGYISALIEAILKNGKNKQRSITLLIYLYNKLDQFYIINKIAVRSETQKDKLASFFVRHFDICNPIAAIDSLKRLSRL